MCLSFCPPHTYGECITSFGLLISGQSGIPVWSKGSFTVWICVCIIYLRLRNLSREQVVCGCVTDYIHKWFNECKLPVSVYYPDYACHGWAVSLHNDRIYLSLSPGGRRPGRTFTRSSFRHNAWEHIFLWKPHHTSLECSFRHISVRIFNYFSITTMKHIPERSVTSRISTNHQKCDLS